jgi:hypothetical protein
MKDLHGSFSISPAPLVTVAAIDAAGFPAFRLAVATEPLLARESIPPDRQMAQ